MLARIMPRLLFVSAPLVSRFKISTVLIGGAYCYYQCNNIKYNTQVVEKFELVQDNKKENTVAMFAGVRKYMWQLLRFFHLLAIFAPSIFLFPLKMFSRTEDIWMDAFVKGIERAGVVWIKTFQYLSHRGDIIGQKLAAKFIHLRQHTPQHSFEETKKSFKKEFGKEINQIFDEFTQKPIASGSVGQVYQAIYKGHKVAVKVRHPGVEKYISRDIDLLFTISRILSKFSGKFQIPVTEDSLKLTLTEQIDFKIEARNLKIFGQMFKHSKQVKFPVSYDQGLRSSVLVESFAEGVPITYFEEHKHKLNKVIARIGATTFFEMLMKNNFIHADCHGGNILVEIKEKSYTLYDQFCDLWYVLYRKVEDQFIKLKFRSEVFRDMYLESKKEEDEVRFLKRFTKQVADVTLIDTGMIIEMVESDRLNFISFLKNVIHQDPEECAKMIYSLSMKNGKKIIEEQTTEFNKKYFQKLLVLFERIKSCSLKELDGNQLFKDMMGIIRNYEMKLDGQFATLLTNMLVLEAMAKELYPDIKILKCAVPYFPRT